jgi:hypothetical protein
MYHFARVQFDDKEGIERPEKQVGNRETRHRPRSAQHACLGRFSNSGLVALQCVLVACISGSCGRQTRRPSLSNSPRIRSAPHSRLSLAISADLGHGLCGYLWFVSSCSGFVLPEEPKTLAMPPRDPSLAGQRTELVARSEPPLPEAPGAFGPF